MTVHKNIKRFYIDGEIYDEGVVPRVKEEYIFMLKMMMKSKGYLVRYDIDPDFSLSYNGKTFSFGLSLYGVYVGKKKAQCYDGVDKNKLIPASTQKNKSGEHSQRVV